MADYKVTDTELTSIANAIRTKGGTSAQLEWPTGFANAIAAIPSGGGGSQIPNAVLIEPYDFDNATGFVSGGNFIMYATNYNVCRNDIYKLDPSEGSTRYFLLFVGQGGGNRFRACVLTTDPKTIPQGTQTTLYGSKVSARNPSAGNWVDLSDLNDPGAFCGYLIKIQNISVMSYLALMKSVENVNNIKTYLLDVTGVV